MAALGLFLFMHHARILRIVRRIAGAADENMPWMWSFTRQGTQIPHATTMNDVPLQSWGGHNHGGQHSNDSQVTLVGQGTIPRIPLVITANGAPLVSRGESLGGGILGHLISSFGLNIRTTQCWLCNQ